MKAGGPPQHTALTRRQALEALGLDVTYERAEGCRLWYRDPEEHVVWDFLGGYGSLFYGHNHPALVDVAQQFLSERRVIHGQASIRVSSERLVERLSELLQASFGVDFDLLLANTGSEAVEVAARHAEEVFERRRARAAAHPHPPSGSATEWTPSAVEILDRHGIPHGREALRHIAVHNRTTLGTPVIHLALERSYHGMTARSLSLTDDSNKHLGLHPTSRDVTFIEASDPDGVVKAIRDSAETLLRPRLQGGRLALAEVSWSPVASLFIEPIQGEGGIRPISDEVARAWRGACDAHGIPMIVDEIQCGLGRTGTLFYSEQLGVRPDYVLLGKSLGGGLAKLSAVAVQSSQFLPGFTLTHASTFAGDDFSSSIAARALELLEEDDALATAAVKGDDLMQQLQGLAHRYPDVISDVRGSGLMIGVEWCTQDFDRSNVLFVLQEYGWLGYALTSFLLHEHSIRIAPTLSAIGTTRIEPSYLVPQEAVDQLLTGLEDLCEVLRTQDSARLLTACMGAKARVSDRLTPIRRVVAEPGPHAHVGFVGHFIEPTDLVLWDSGLEGLEPAALDDFLERIYPLVEPVVVQRAHVSSANGEKVTVSFIGLAVTSDRFYRSLRTTERRALRALVQRGVDLAATEGCSVVGLGGYCSIITRNGKSLRTDGPAITTGNGYTVGAGLEAIRATAEEIGLELQNERIAVVGANGNLGAVLSELLAEDARSLVLIGRASRQDALEALAGRILRGLTTRAPRSSIARALALSPLSTLSESLAADEYFRATREALGAHCPIEVGSELGLCRDARVIVTASNESQPILFPEHVPNETVVVADFSVPPDVHPTVSLERPGARVIRGGVVRTPANPSWSLPGIPLAPGEMFACMTETVLMGLEDHTTHGSYGALTAARVHETMSMASRHGFSSIRTAMVSSY
jgi:acetylornithine/succinyldiaminopimelate/putrescine aminotransferase/predicted amino acid dehydrogenase